MTTLEMNIAAQQVIDFNLDRIKFTVRRCYRQSETFERLSRTWLDRLPEAVNEKIKTILDLSDGSYSFHDVAVKAMKEKSVKAGVIL